MKISGSYTLSAPPDLVWNALFDPDTLKRALPGCESVTRMTSDDYTMRLNVGVAGVKGIYDGTVHALDAQQPESYRLVVDGSGARGILHADGMVHLTAQGANATVVSYAGEAQVGGALASLGPQVTIGAANMLIRQYFAHLAATLPAPVAVAASNAYTIPEAPPAPAPPPATASVMPPVMPVMPAEPVVSMAAMTATTLASEMPTDGATDGAMGGDPLPDSSPTESGASDASAPEPVAPTPDAAAPSVDAPVDALMPPPTAPIHSESQVVANAESAPMAATSVTPATSALASETPATSAPAATPTAPDAAANGPGAGRALSIALFVVLIVIIAVAIWFFTH